MKKHYKSLFLLVVLGGRGLARKDANAIKTVED